MRLALVLALLLAPLVGGCGDWSGLADLLGLEPGEPIVEERPDPAYEELFPYYVELCAVSQFRSKGKGIGGVPGHAVMYLKGACKDEAAPYPRLRRCARVASDLADPEHGVGVSVNRWFRNVNWVAVPDNALFYAGAPAPGEPIDEERLARTVRAAIEAGVYDGVELHEYPGRRADSDLEDFVTRLSLGTDFALQFARSVFCARLPVTEAMIGKSMDFLNELNHEFATGEADYEWSGISDNCVHTVRNALAAASVWSPLSVRTIKVRQLFNLAIPANEFVNLARLGGEGPIDDYPAIHRDLEQRLALLAFDWLPTRHGALVKTLPVHVDNDLYETKLRLFALQSPLRRGARNAALRLLSDERFVDLDANLAHFRRVYRQILEQREAPGFSALRGDRYRAGRRRYFAYVEKQLAQVEAMIARLAARGGDRGERVGGRR